MTCSCWPRLFEWHRQWSQYAGIRSATLLRAFVLSPGFTSSEVAEPLTALDVDLLVHVALRHVLLVCATVTVHMDHYVLLTVALGKGCQWNLSCTAFVSSSVHHVAAYSSVSDEDLFVGLALT